MRLLYVTPGCFDKGGVSRYNRYQIAALRDILGRSGVRVLSMLPPDANSFEEPFAVNWFGKGSLWRRRFGLSLRVLSEVIRWRPHVVLTSLVNFSAMTQLLSRITRSFTVVNIYGSEVWSGFRYGAGWGLRQANMVISDCHFTARYVEDQGLRSAGSSRVIWDCVDAQRFSPGNDNGVIARLGVPDRDDDVRILSLGRMSREASHKGYERLLEVFVALSREKANVRLLYGGSGDLVPLLKERARHLNVSNRVHFLGSIHEHDLPLVYRAAHVFSLVSDRGVRRGEGIPLTPLEAAACGTPIIVGDEDGSQEAVVEGRNGFVVSPRDSTSHLAALRALVHDAELRRRMSAGARAVVLKNFTFERFVERHSELILCLQQNLKQTAES